MSMVWQRFKAFNRVFDDRFEDLTRDSWPKTVYRDLSAGLIVALTAIPMAMGFAMAMGLRPEQGIIAGAVACIIGRTWGGSKYQVYGPSASIIPLVSGLMLKYGEANGGSFATAHGFLVLCSMIAGAVLMTMGLAGLGKLVRLVPNSIVVGFTIGMALVIASSNLGEALGMPEPLRGNLFEKLRKVVEELPHANGYAVFLAVFTFFATRYLLKLSIYIPAPLLSLGVATVLAATAFAGKGVVLVKDEFGAIPHNFFVFTPPVLPEATAGVFLDIAYFVVAIVFISAVESLLCSSMADRLADNRKTPFNPDKEFWGQGMVQTLTPLLNGFPCMGVLARTATSIKVGAVTPLAGYFKGFLKLGFAYFLAPYLELVPMACIGGILLWVASNMVKVAEVKKVWNHHWFHAALMIYTAAMVPLTDFLTGVLSALVLYAVLHRFFDKPKRKSDSPAFDGPLEVAAPVRAGRAAATISAR